MIAVVGDDVRTRVALAVLELSEHGGAVPFAVIALRLGLEESIVHRELMHLHVDGVVTVSSVTRRVWPAVRVVGVGRGAA